MMGRGGPSDEQKAQIARFQEIEAKIQRGEAREEDYPDYMEAKRGYAAKKDKEADNIDPDTGISCTTPSEVVALVNPLREKWRSGGADAALHYLEYEIPKLTFKTYLPTVNLFR
jgi:hypothetical protein